MASLVKVVSDLATQGWPEVADPRTGTLWLMDSHVYMWLPPVLYLVACWLLMRAMRGRAAFDVPTWFQAAHNGFLVLLSVYMALTILYEAFVVSGYGLTCNRVVPGARARICSRGTR